MSGGSDMAPVLVGRVSGLFGVRGWCKVYSYTQPREALLDYSGWQIGREGDWRPVEVAEGQRHGKTVIIRLDGIDDRDTAASLVGCDIAVPRSALPNTEQGTYYWHDLEGLDVVRQDGTVIGIVKELIETGANDVLVVNGDQEVLIPFVIDKVVTDVDLAEGRIVVDWEWD